MSGIDIVFLILLGIGAFQGFRKGFLLEIIAILAFILAIIGAFKLLHLGMAFLGKHFNLHGELLPYIAFLIIFVAIIILVNLLGKILKKVLDLTLLGAIDNVAGAFLATLKWAFGISTLLWLSTSFGIKLPENWTENSLMYPILLPLAPKVVEYFSTVVPFAHDLFDLIKDMLQDDPPA